MRGFIKSVALCNSLDGRAGGIQGHSWARLLQQKGLHVPRFGGENLPYELETQARD